MKNSFSEYLPFSWVVCIYFAYDSYSKCILVVPSHILPPNYMISFDVWLKVEGFTTLSMFLMRMVMLLVEMRRPELSSKFTYFELMLFPFKLFWLVFGVLIFLGLNPNSCGALMRTFMAAYFFAFGSTLFISVVSYLKKIIHDRQEEVKVHKLLIMKER